jgi:hypothetical protein
MTTLNILFHNLCTAYATHNSMPAKQRNKVALRKAGTQTFELATSLIPEIIKSGQTGDALVTAMQAKSVELINAFPEADYGTYAIESNASSYESLLRDMDPDIILALSSRGLSFSKTPDPLLIRAFRQSDEKLRQWALEYHAKDPTDFWWLSNLTSHNIRRNPEFAEALVSTAVASDPAGAERALADGVTFHRDGLRVALLMNAGVSEDVASQRDSEEFRSLSSHARMKFMRGSITAFAKDEDAVRYARNLWK